MTQYCCRLDEGTLLAMEDLGNGWYQCPKCTGLRRKTGAVVERVSHSEFRAIAEADRLEAEENMRAAVGAVKKVAKVAVVGLAAVAAVKLLTRR